MLRNRSKRNIEKKVEIVALVILIGLGWSIILLLVIVSMLIVIGLGRRYMIVFCLGIISIKNST